MPICSAAQSLQASFTPQVRRGQASGYIRFVLQILPKNISSRPNLQHLGSPSCLKRPVVGRQTTTVIRQTTEEHISPLPPLLPQMSNFPERDEKASNCVQSNRAREEKGRKDSHSVTVCLQRPAASSSLASCRRDYTSFHAQSDAKFIKLGASLIRQISVLRPSE